MSLIWPALEGVGPLVAAVLDEVPDACWIELPDEGDPVPCGPRPPPTDVVEDLLCHVNPMEEGPRVDPLSFEPRRSCCEDVIPWVPGLSRVAIFYPRFCFWADLF